ncbi:hypothetical protein DFH07DRAFT_771949 [Mycena maculata]|uniref:Uncharacterized protein n=1 Tax=Mycena maculata TaxID=230809 RepID=A0AAD7NGP6_9AGAR|nr:hypothetical protein DFH07DRAFT_771949 [Mycena maculata]
MDEPSEDGSGYRPSTAPDNYAASNGYTIGSLYNMGQSLDDMDWGTTGPFSSQNHSFSVHPGRHDHFRPSISGSSASSSGRSFQYQTAQVQHLQQLEKVCNDLRKEILVLTTENRSIKDMYKVLVDRIPGLLTGTPTAGSGYKGTMILSRNDAPPLDRNKYPLVLYWEAHEWMQHENVTKGLSDGKAPGPRGSLQASQGINVSMCFVQSEDGKVIDGHQATRIRDLAHQLWGELGAHGLAPSSWQKGTRDIQDHVYAEVGKKYPEMRLCRDDWKTKHMATAIYSSWYSSFTTVTNEAGKRVRLKKGPQRKRAKIEMESPDPLSGLFTIEPKSEMEIHPTPSSDTVLVPNGSDPPRAPIKIVNPLYSSPEPETQRPLPTLLAPTQAPQQAPTAPAVPVATSDPPETFTGPPVVLPTVAVSDSTGPLISGGTPESGVMPVTTGVTVPTPDIAASTDAPGTTPLTITGPGRALGPVAMPSGLIGAPAISAPAGASIAAKPLYNRLVQKISQGNEGPIHRVLNQYTGYSRGTAKNALQAAAAPGV